MELLHTLAAFILALGVLVTVHEFGHYWVARRLGVKILKFSVGFGSAIWSRRYGADATEFAIAWVPLGGYVKMLDEREGPVPVEDRQRAFNHKPLGTRVAVVLAGPLANLLFAVAAYMVMYMVGIAGLAPVIGTVTPGSLAAQAGLESGMRVVSVDGQPASTWDAFVHATLQRVVERRVLTVQARAGDGIETTHVLDLGAIEVDELTNGNLFERIGAEPERLRVPAVIGELERDGAAARAGFAGGDRVVAVDGTPIDDWETWAAYVRARPGERLRVSVERAGHRVDLEVTPAAVEEGGKRIGRVGARVDQAGVVDTREAGLERYGPIAALLQGVRKSWDMSMLTVRILGKMLTLEASVKNLSGPISIAKFAGQSADLGIARFLEFLGMVSVSLFVLNLLPIPLLDGGHLMYYLIELVTRRPVSESLQAYGQQVGLVLLLGLMGLAFYNDLMRIL